ncbi:MAG: hypothetical protein WCS28_11890 [Thiomicrospira sp.]
MSYYFASVEHIETLKEEIAQYKLKTPPGFDGTGMQTLRRCYNGIGPDAWSNRFRQFTTKILRAFEPEALIHDWEYTFMPKTYKAFTAANFRFLVNGILYSYKAWPKSAFLRQCGRCVVLALLCQLFGWRGYREAVNVK